MERVTSIERVLLALQAEPGLSDAELRQRAQVNPHQQVNQICRRLERERRLRPRRASERVLVPSGGSNMCAGVLRQVSRSNRPAV